MDKIRSVKEILDTQHILNSSKFIFRGQANSEWDVLPNILRLGLNRNEVEILEIALLEPFIKGEVRHLKSYDPIEYLTVLQHYNVPTKLLDWSLNPLKALFFACYDKEGKYTDKDGTLFATTKSFFHSLNMSGIEFNKFKNKMTDDNIDEYMPRLLNNDTIKFFEPYIKNPRLEAQEGCFMYFTLLPLNEGEEGFVHLQQYIAARNKKYEEANKTNDNLEFEVYYLHKLIDKSCKQSILKDLKDNFNISETTMFLNQMDTSDDDKYFEAIYATAKKKVDEFINRERLEKSK